MQYVFVIEMSDRTSFWHIFFTIQFYHHQEKIYLTPGVLFFSCNSPYVTKNELTQRNVFTAI